MNWIEIKTVEELESALGSSTNSPVLLFKHSTRCSISINALSRFERKWEIGSEKIISPFYIDLLKFRKISDLIAHKTGIEHESPQAIVLHEGKVIYHATHNGIDFKEIMSSIES